MRNYFDLSFDLPSDGNVKRSAYRAKFRGIFVRMDGANKVYEIIDISTTGWRMRTEPHEFKLGRILCANIIIGRRVIVNSLQTEVVRLLSDSVVACAFRELSRRQEYNLDKLILEIQKREISNTTL